MIKENVMNQIWDGIIIGGAGGAIAGLTVYLVGYVHKKVVKRIEKDRVYDWLKASTKDKIGERYRSTRAIASWNNMTEDTPSAISRIICKKAWKAS
jgi:hypothetical protein